MLDHAETTKEKRARYATLTTIDEIDNLVSQNEVSLENFEVEDDQSEKVLSSGSGSGSASASASAPLASPHAEVCKGINGLNKVVLRDPRGSSAE
ncbi:hypothetical protein CMV_024143, partial [Castanea mollissima]